MIPELIPGLRANGKSQRVEIDGDDRARRGITERERGREIHLIGTFEAAVKMARAMVDMKLAHAPPARPSDTRKAKPAYR